MLIKKTIAQAACRDVFLDARSDLTSRLTKLVSKLLTNGISPTRQREDELQRRWSHYVIDPQLHLFNCYVSGLT